MAIWVTSWSCCICCSYCSTFLLHPLVVDSCLVVVKKNKIKKNCLFSLFPTLYSYFSLYTPISLSHSSFVHHTHTRTLKLLGRIFVCIAHEFSLEYSSIKINSWKQQVRICRDYAFESMWMCERAAGGGGWRAFSLCVWSCIIDWIQPPIYRPGFGLKFIVAFLWFKP